MEQCWAAKPSLRPLLGHVQPQLEAIQERALKEDPEGKSLSFSCTTPLFQTFRNDSIYTNYDIMQIREFYWVNQGNCDI